ncbi:hypothetical protein KDK77_03690 [bacterium]|nr:hypothetical protein [bacterium]
MLKHDENIALWQTLYGISLLVFFFAFEVIDVFFWIVEIIVCYCCAPFILIDAFLRFNSRPFLSETHPITYCAGTVLFCMPVVLIEGYIVYEMAAYHDALIGITYHIYAGIMLLAFLELMQSYFSPHKTITDIMAGVALCCTVCSLAVIRNNWLLSGVFTMIYISYFAHLECGTIFRRKKRIFH